MAAADSVHLHLYTWSPSAGKVLEPQLPSLQPKLTAVGGDPAVSTRTSEELGLGTAEGCMTGVGVHVGGAGASFPLCFSAAGG